MNNLLHRLCYKTTHCPNLQWDATTRTLRLPDEPGHAFSVTYLDNLRITEVQRTVPRWPWMATVLRLWHNILS